MKYIIVNKFKDIYTGEQYHVNDIVSFSDSRIKEIKAVEKVKKISLIKEYIEENNNTETENIVSNDTEETVESKKNKRK